VDAARTAGQPIPDAMTIASATSDGVPPARLVVRPDRPGYSQRPAANARDEMP
jgi:hypothetical protein